MKRINKIIDLIEKKQPVYYISTSDFSYSNGKKLSKTWADFIRLDTEHSSNNWDGIADLMRGLNDGGPTKSGHKTPAVLAELPFDGINRQNVQANSWVIKQILAKGVHGLILCHANSPQAVKEFVEQCRFRFRKKIGKNILSEGKRGHGGQVLASKIWRISEQDYLEKADPWPLNPNGELILGIKLENNIAIKNCSKSLKIPGIAFGDYGLGDISFSQGYRTPVKFPLPKKIILIRDKVWKACIGNKKYFWAQVTKESIKEMIDEGLMFIRVYSKSIAVIGRKYTKRKKNW